MAGSTPTRATSQDDDIVTEPLGEIIDPENFTPRLLALLSNALVWRESHELRRRFRLGTNDWRVISALALRPGSSATEVSEFIGVNKAVVSKSVTTLQARELIRLVEGPRGSRPMFLTPSGAQMHHDMLPISMSGQHLIHEGLDPEHIQQLNALLRRMIEQVRDAPADVVIGAPAATGTPAAGR
jgi:DNA-binding MarR family transcriptional regulator